ncbi:MAG: signal peptidase II [Treponema sp.]|nr:signal peptidase II [Treponema sp.]
MSLKCKFDKERGLPLILTGFVILLDQITKAFIAARWPIYPGDHIRRIWPEAGYFHPENLLQIIHVRNTAIAFSIGQGLPPEVKRILFVILPIIVLIVLVWYYLSSDEFTKLQRWAIAGILGGGIGNIADRIFRTYKYDGELHGGVVDFISVRFFGLFGFERWPTFNVADSSVVVSCLLLLVTIFVSSKKSVTSDCSIEQSAKQSKEPTDEQET